MGVKSARNMKKISLIFLITLIEGVLLSNGVIAYIDPSTGGVLLNTIWPLIVAFFTAVFAFGVKWFWNPIKKLFTKFLGSQKRAKD